MAKDKCFLSYEEQIKLLKSKKLKINNEQIAISFLKRFSYYSLVSGYRDIFKQSKNGDYREDASFEHLVYLYLLDDYLRNIFLHRIIIIEKHIKSLYSYSFCEMFGDNQNDYLNVLNYNYGRFQSEVNDFVSIVRRIINHSSKYPYVNHYIEKYGEVPLWVIIHTLTFGNISKMFSFSQESLQSQVARNFENVYGKHLVSMLNVISKFRNVCAHGERLYNFKTKSAIDDLPLHSEIKGMYSISKNDLFNVCIAFKYLLTKDEFDNFLTLLGDILNVSFKQLGEYYKSQILKSMGFPTNWKEILKL